MRTSKEWWNEVKNNQKLFNEWLIKQYRGEVTAADRITQIYKRFDTSEKNIRILNVIAAQERQHAEWIGDILKSRGIEPSIENAESRYWAQTLQGIEDFHTGTAVAAHAEKMRLERIRTIVEDEDSPSDIRSIFRMILRDEEFHERAFREMTTPEALNQTSNNHELGLKALGLTI